MTPSRQTKGCRLHGRYHLDVIVLFFERHEFLDSLQAKINAAGEAIHETFFSGSANGHRCVAFAD